MERMLTRNDSKMEAAQMPQDMPTSPWTETFQNAETFTSHAASQANHPSQTATGAQDQQIQAQRHADADAARPTQDALSEIFNGV